MKVLLTAFALLSFIAASALPMTASAEDMKGDQSTTTTPDTASKPDAGTSADKGTTDNGAGKSATSASHKTTHKSASHKTKHHKTSKKKTHHHKHTASHKAKPAGTSSTPKQG